MVLRVDKEKGYIDLSKRRVSPEDIAASEERYNKSKMVCLHSGQPCVQLLATCHNITILCRACRCTASSGMLRRPLAQTLSSCTFR